VTNIASVTVAVCGTVTAGVVISLPATATPAFPRSRPWCLAQVNGVRLAVGVLVLDQQIGLADDPSTRRSASTTGRSKAHAL